MGRTALLPLRRKACWGFFRPEKSDVFGRAWTRELGYQRDNEFVSSGRLFLKQHCLLNVPRLRSFFLLLRAESKWQLLSGVGGMILTGWSLNVWDWKRSSAVTGQRLTAYPKLIQMSIYFLKSVLTSWITQSSCITYNNRKMVSVVRITENM